METQAIREANKNYWNANADSWFGVTALPEYGTLFVKETDLHLFGDVQGAKMLEIGCGSGHSLVYHAQRGAGELWGLDISQSQLSNAGKHLQENGVSAKLICSPMEQDCGIPANYFDFIYSIYAMGWTIDLEHTFRKVASYLKAGGTFIFSWKHPLNFCTTLDGDAVNLSKPYFDEAWFTFSLDGEEMILCNRMISTYVNALAKAGFLIEQLVEQTDAQVMNETGPLTDQMRKAQMLPLSFVFKARKL